MRGLLSLVAVFVMVLQCGVRAALLDNDPDVQGRLFHDDEEADCVVKTTKGECCAFPFIYGGKTYHHCTMDKHRRQWCSTTPNYDEDRKWGNCKEIVPYTPIPGGKYIGNMPEVPTTITYNLTTNVNPLATEVFIYAYVTTHNIGSYQRGYYVIWTEKDGVKFEQYMNIATGFPSVTINSGNMWLPISDGANSQIHIKLYYPQSESIAHKEGLSAKSENCHFTGESSGVFIIGYK